MSDFYADMQAVASDLLAEFSQPIVTLTRQGTVTPSANEWDEPTIGDPSTWTLDAVVKGVSYKYVDNVNIMASDLEVTAAVFDDVPKLSDALTINGAARTILRIIPIPASGTVCAWKLLAR